MLLALTVTGAAAQAGLPGSGKSGAPALNAAAKLESGKARREADERQRRWDDRMRRATRSMCIGC